MDFSKIKLNNERNEHVTKRLNRLNTWNFFRVLYRDNLLRLFGFSILMIICMAPVIAFVMLASVYNNELLQTLPVLNGYGFSTGIWEGMTEYYQQQVNHNNLYVGLICVAASLTCAFIFSGGFAVIRDAFWTGKLSTVGVFRSMGKGIKAGILYSLATNLVLSFIVFGLYEFYVWASAALPLWAAILILVLLCIAAMFVAIYLFIVCSVAVTYKQSVRDTLDDSWRLMWLNILPNILNFLIALAPIALYFALQQSTLVMLVLVILMMFGGMYVPLVWQSHMMRTFALFHPVEVKKKKRAQAEEAQLQTAASAEEQPKQQRGGRKQKRGKAAQDAPDTSVEDAASDDDVYAADEADAYEIQDKEKDETSADEQ